GPQTGFIVEFHNKYKNSKTDATSGNICVGKTGPKGRGFLRCSGVSLTHFGGFLHHRAA
ncbi:hypothetical protein SAMN05421579_1791, partial [Xenorhabdus japonica]